MKFLGAFVLFVALVVYPAGVWAEATPDRRAAVEVVFQHFLPLLRVLQDLKENEDLSTREKRLVITVERLAASGAISLKFISDQNFFNLRPGEPTRPMATEYGPPRPGEEKFIFVNEPLLNSAGLQDPLDLALLFKLVFHEFTRKTTDATDADLGFFDALAQKFENQLRGFNRSSQLDESSELVILSPPADLVDRKLGPTNLNRPEATNIVLFRAGSQYHDLTEMILSQMEGVTSNLRSVTTEMNRAILTMMGQMTGMLDEISAQLEPVVRAMAGLFGDSTVKGWSELRDKLQDPISEVRKLEILRVSETELAPGEQFVTLRSLYTLGRSRKNEIRLNFNVGFEGDKWQDSFTAAQLIQFRLRRFPDGKVAIDDFRVSLRPDVDYKKVAVIRETSVGTNPAFRVILPENESGKIVTLLLNYGRGTLSIRSTQIEKSESGIREALFELPPFVLDNEVPFVAEAVTVDFGRSYLLDRALLVNRSRTRQWPRVRSEIVPGTVGFWGLQNGKKVFKKDFKYDDPAFFIDGLLNERFSLNPGKLTLDFIVAGETKIKEIRIHMNRVLTAIEVNASDQAPHPLDIDGEIWRFSHAGSFRGMRSIREVITVAPNDIYRSETAIEDQQLVRAIVKVPYKGLVPNQDSRVVHGPPLATPIMIEVVTEGLETLSHHFSSRLESEPCYRHLEKALEGAKPEVSIKFGYD